MSLPRLQAAAALIHLTRGVCPDQVAVKLVLPYSQHDQRPAACGTSHSCKAWEASSSLTAAYASSGTRRGTFPRSALAYVSIVSLTLGLVVSLLEVLLCRLPMPPLTSDLDPAIIFKRKPMGSGILPPDCSLVPPREGLFRIPQKTGTDVHNCGRRIGWVSFWLQLALSIVSAIVLFFTATTASRGMR